MDFDFLNGSFDVVHRQLVKPLTGSTEWEEHRGTCIARTHFDGAVSIDEMAFTDKGYYGMSIRLFDPAAQEWTVWWVTSRDGRLQPPVRGRWVDGRSWLVGEDTYDGRPVLVSYEWSDITATTARWQQAFSVDNGATWETNWIMEFTRRETAPAPLGMPKLTDDFDFLAGSWNVANRRLRRPLAADSEWYETPARSRAWVYFDGLVSVDEIEFSELGTRGLTIRLFEPSTRTWSIYWVSSSDVRLQPPVHGTFAGDLGIFEGEDEYDDQPIRVRFHWNRALPVWEQYFSTDAGRTWQANWQMTFTRQLADSTAGA